MKKIAVHPMTTPPRAMLGISMVELMIAMLLGLFVLAGLATLFASSSAARTEMERSSRQIENGRFAMELISDDLRLAGFYGELSLDPGTYPAVMPDPCSVDPVQWRAALPIAVQHYDNAVGVPGCMGITARAGTDVVVVRRVSSCEAGVGTCPNLLAGLPYLQVAKCKTQTLADRNMPNSRYVLERMGTGVFDRKLKDCANNAGARQYLVRAYFIADDNGSGVSVPTLKRVDFNGVGYDRPVALVEGIEALNVEYGIDNFGIAADVRFLEGSPDVYTANPATYAVAGCVNFCTAVHNMGNIVTARVNLLARNIEASPSYTDNKTYSLGRDAAGVEFTITPGGNYRRHVYSGVVRVVNVSQRRERVPAGL